jgi:L-alanine-DL-glutamate epimerase-like enolase superfamily enzyme
MRCLSKPSKLPRLIPDAAISGSSDTLDFKPHESPVQHEVVDDPWVQNSGMIALRDEPGLGISADEQAVKRLTFV